MLGINAAEWSRRHRYTCTLPPVLHSPHIVLVQAASYNTSGLVVGECHSKYNWYFDNVSLIDNDSFKFHVMSLTFFIPLERLHNIIQVKIPSGRSNEVEHFF